MADILREEEVGGEWLLAVDVGRVLAEEVGEAPSAAVVVAQLGHLGHVHRALLLVHEEDVAVRTGLGRGGGTLNAGQCRGAGVRKVDESVRIAMQPQSIYCCCPCRSRCPVRARARADGCV